MTAWCKANLPSNFFKESTIAISEYTTLVSWANTRSDHFTTKAIGEFLETDLADAWIIAYAMNQGFALLSHEKSEPERKNRIKIPDVCDVFGISYFDTIGMLRNLKQTI